MAQLIHIGRRNIINNVRPNPLRNPLPRLFSSVESKSFRISPYPARKFYMDLFAVHGVYLDYALIFKRAVVQEDVLNVFNNLSGRLSLDLTIWLTRFKYDSLPANFYVPTHFDWTRLGAMTPVKDQGDRGTCCAHACIAAIEGLMKRKRGIIMSLSVEQLIQQNFDFCDGSTFQANLSYFLASEMGLTSASMYPYNKKKKRGIRKSGNFFPVATINGFRRVRPYDENELKIAVLNQPVTVKVYAHPSWSEYTGGICTRMPTGLPHNLNHLLVVVGYGVEHGIPFWRCKNSWGVEWGEEGYIRIMMGKNLAGISIDASYPL